MTADAPSPRPLRAIVEWLRDRDWLFIVYVAALTAAFSGWVAVVVHVGRELGRCR